MLNVHPKSTASLVRKLNASIDNRSHVIPKQVFFFWDRLPMPKFVQHCLELWKRRNSDHDVYLIDEVKIHHILQGDLPENLNRLHISQKSDWYRLSLLEKYGGIYIDAATICLAPLGSWIDHNLDALQGFNVPTDKPDIQIMENWAIASPRGNTFIAQWREEFRRAVSIGFDNYKRVCQTHSNPLMAYLLPDKLPYLSCHAAWINTRTKNSSASVVLRSSDVIDGPFGWLEEAEWNKNQAVSNILQRPANHYVSPFLKIRCCDRLEIDKYVLRRQYSDKSIFCEELGLPRSSQR